MNVGEYVRTKYGINKIISNPNENKFNIDAFKKDGITLRCIRQKDVVKSSPQIIDLIEKNDYVNGYLVIEELYTYHGVKFISVDTQDSWSWGKGEMPIENKNIKTIITHEQMEAMQYRVEE